MAIHESDLFCPTCGGYVHPFLDRCPPCGATRETRLGDVRSDPVALGATAVAEDPEVRHAATRQLDRYALTAPRAGLPRRTGFEGAAEPNREVMEVAALLTGVVIYRGYGSPPEPKVATDVSVAVTADTIEIRDPKSKAARLRFPLSGILSIVAPSGPTRRLPGWAGVVGGGTTEVRSLLVPAASLLFTYAADRSLGQMSLESRSGFFTTQVRGDHWPVLVHWLGIVAAAAAEQRWTAIGLRRYLAEVGLGPAPAPLEQPAMAIGDDAAKPIRAALEELEALRAADLVSDAEYHLKRQQILDRL